MSDATQKIILILKTKKMIIFKILITYLVCLFIFSLIIFPFGYLSSYLTTAIAQATGNQVFVKSKGINLNLIPSLGVELSDVELETTQLPKLKAQSLIISPSLISLIRNIPNITNPTPGSAPPIPDVSLRLSDFLGSNTEAQIKKSDEKQKIKLNIKSLNLKELSSLGLLPISLIGPLNLKLDSLVDLSFKDQPEGDVEIDIQKLTIPSTNIPIPNMGSIPLPRISVSDVKIKGRISGGKLIIEQAQLGKPNESLSLQLKGQLSLNLLPSAGGPRLAWGAYDIQTLFNIDAKLADELFLSAFLTPYKVRQSQQKITYGVRVAGSSFYSPPTSTNKIESMPRN